MDLLNPAEVERLLGLIRRFDAATRCPEGGRMWSSESEVAADALLAAFEEVDAKGIEEAKNDSGRT